MRCLQKIKSVFTASNNAWFAIIPVVLVCAAAVNQLRVTMQEQIVALVCDEYKQTNHSVTCDDKRIIHDANQWVQYGQTAFGVANLLMSSIYGSLSDRYGRKLVMWMSILGNVVIALASAYVGTWHTLSWRAVLTAASAVGGLGGGTTITLMGAFAFVADSCPPKHRTTTFTLIEAFYGVGGMLAYLGGGYLSTQRGETYTLWIIVGVLSVLCLYISMIPESLEPQHKSKMRCKKLHSFRAVLVLLQREEGLSSNALRSRVAILVAFAVAFMGFLGGFNVTTLFFKTSQYNWSDYEIGLYNSVCQGARALTLVLAPIISCMHLQETQKRSMIQSFLVIFGLCNIAIPWTTDVVYICLLGGTAGLVLPTAFGYLRGMVSASVSPTMQGEALGGLAFVESLDTLLASILFNSLFNINVPSHGGGVPANGSAAFWAIGAFGVLAGLVLFLSSTLSSPYLTLHRERQARTLDESDDDDDDAPDNVRNSLATADKAAPVNEMQPAPLSVNSDAIHAETSGTDEDIREPVQNCERTPLLSEA
eukprot:m.532525 g.532525  ORF g.532525 m.532525 type:complete len:536 (+) comp22046_c0_seq4:270-1877(+)